MRKPVVFLIASLAMAADPAPRIDAAKLKLFAPLPDAMVAAKNPLTEEKVQLGRMLYYEPRLSVSQDVSCNTCHLLDKYGVDGKPVSSGFKGQTGDRNAPTVYHAAGHVAQFWDGRAADVEEQAKGPVMNPLEMAMPSEQHVVAVLKSIPEYRDAFQRAFPNQADPVTFDNTALAIAAFERKLVTPARWDRFLKGDKSALSTAEIAGFNKFVEVGCQGCHAGAYLGGNAYQKLGIAKPWPKTKDPGRYTVTKQEKDRMFFKVPSLRNIEKTGPYLHDGSVAKLEETVRLMAEYENGKRLTDNEVQSMAAWLKTLSGELPAAYIQPPPLPKSTPQTPKPKRG